MRAVAIAKKLLAMVNISKMVYVKRLTIFDTKHCRAKKKILKQGIEAPHTTGVCMDFN